MTWLLSLLLLLPVAAPVDSSAAVRLMEARYRLARTLQATFLEEYKENGRVVRVESGTAYFKRPGKMRWEYEIPEKNLFLVDGKTAWFYVPGDHTVTRVPAKESTDFRTPLALLAGEMKVSRVCAKVRVASDEKPTSEENVVLSCVLKGDESSSAHSSGHGAPHGSEAQDTVLFEIVRTSGDLARLLIRQQDGVQVEFRFRNWRIDPAVPESMFHFQAPSGVAIVNGELPAKEFSAN